MRLRDKVALVTGGACGLGEAICRAYVAEGASVVIADIDEQAGEALAGEIGTAARFLRLDVTKEDDWTRGLATFDRLDILVNNAGVAILGDVEQVSLEQFRQTLDVDLVGVFLGCKHAIPVMKRHGGCIINMSSMSGVRAQAELCAYNAAKGGVTLLTKSVALHCAKQKNGIRCNSIHPGAIHTPLIDKVLGAAENRDEIYASWVATHPIGRLGQPAEVASLAVYLGSDESAFATGAEFRLDGGSTI